MKHSITRHIFRILLCAVALCTVLASCAPAPSDEETGKSTAPYQLGGTTLAPRETQPIAEAAISPADSGFVGTWVADSNNLSIVSMAFHEDGTAELKKTDGSLGGSFIVTGSDTVVIVFGGTPADTSYTLADGVLTLKNDTMDLTLRQSA